MAMTEEESTIRKQDAERREAKAQLAQLEIKRREAEIAKLQAEVEEIQRRLDRGIFTPRIIAQAAIAGLVVAGLLAAWFIGYTAPILSKDSLKAQREAIKAELWSLTSDNEKYQADLRASEATTRALQQQIQALQKRHEAALSQLALTAEEKAPLRTTLEAVRIPADSLQATIGQLETPVVSGGAHLAQAVLSKRPRAEGTGILGIAWDRIPAGAFLMGSEKGESDDEYPQRQVWLDAFEIMRYPLTNAQYSAFLDANPTHRAPSVWSARTYPEGQGDHPVVGLSWADAQACAQWLSKETGQTIRLPTEAEWEKAARGEDGRRYPWGSEFSANKTGIGSTAVGAYPEGASPYGVQDMAGNGWEWCADWYDKDYYKYAPDRNPKGPETGEYRVVRGGSWLDFQYFARCANRYRYLPVYRYDYVGVRFSRT